MQALQEQAERPPRERKRPVRQALGLQELGLLALGLQELA
jgi:hypothetical protein